jgi:hypothetical protein
MFKLLGLLVHVLPVHLQLLHKEGFDEPVLAQNQQRMGAPFRGKARTLPVHMIQQTLGG